MAPHRRGPADSSLKDAGDAAWADTAPPEPQPDDAHTANGLIKAATDPKTGKVNTGQLAQQVADTASYDPDKAGAAYTAVQAHLQKSDPQAAGQFNHDVVQAFGDAAKGTAPGVYRAGGEVLKSNPILTKQWEFTKSA